MRAGGNSQSRENIGSELESARKAFHDCFSSLSEEDLRKPSKVRAWTNEQLLFHVTFGYMLIPSLFWLILFFGRIPKGFSKIFSLVLNLCTPLFLLADYTGPWGGARVYSGKRLLAKYDRTLDSVLRRLNSTDDRELELAMYYPKRWDPLFDEYMTIGALFLYPTRHQSHHLEQVVS